MAAFDLRDLFNLYRDGLFRYALSRVGQREVAEEILQEVFLSLLKNPAVLQGYEPEVWLFTAVRGKSLDALKRQAVQRRYLEHLRREFSFKPPSAQDRQTAEALSTCFPELPDEAREIVLLKVWENMSFDRIAALTGQSAGTVRTRYAEALQQLRACISSKHS